MNLHFTATQAMNFAAQAVAQIKFVPQEEDPHFGPRVVPHELRGWFARLRLLQGVPFSYLVADAQLLPRESIRFFYLDRAWTDALVQGALSVGTVNSSDRAELAALYKPVRAEIDEEERRVRLPGGEAVQQGAAGTVTGFVLRSRAVSGWPGLHVRAYDRELGQADDAAIPESDPRRMKVLRMERLAPAVLLVLFDGIPAVVHIEEPRQGIQFGVRLVGSGGDTPNTFQANIKARNAHTSNDVNADPDDVVKVPFRPGSPGVVDIRKLNQALLNTPGTNMGPAVDGAEYALQMLRFPYRQVFGDPSVSAPPKADVFRPTLAMGELLKRFTPVP
jgi:hypothetical protein